MREICSRTVDKFGEWWITIGWMGFISTLVAMNLARGSGAGLFVITILALITVIWWLVDGINQEIPAWGWAAGIALLGIGSLRLGSIHSIFLYCAAWTLYVFRLRE